MYTRPLYLNKIAPFIDKPVVKVITGMRRVGKSYLLRQLIERFTSSGVPRESILYIDKESLAFEAIRTYEDLNRVALEALERRSGLRYLLVDEVQEITGWEKAIASLANREDIDIYITGSNAHLFSSELASLLSGRFVEFPIYSLSFAEFRLFRGDRVADVSGDFERFLRFGGMPAIHHFDLEEEIVFQYIGAIYDTILLKDIVKRHSIRNVQLLENIARYLFDNIGNVCSAKKIADYLKSQRLRVGVETVQNYLAHFVEALIAHRVPRYDLKGKRLLEVHEKYYLGDTGIRHALLGYREADVSGILENIVFLELKRRGYQVYVGKFGDREVDFVATREREKLYVQVAYLLAAPETVDREFGVLRQIRDNYPKLVLSLDTAFGEDIEGIRRLNLIDFLLEQEGAE